MLVQLRGLFLYNSTERIDMSVTWKTLTASTLVSLVRTKIYNIVLTPSSNSTYGILYVYDGESMQETELIRIIGLTGSTSQVIFDPPIETMRGLYIRFASNAYHCLVEYEEVEA